MKLAFCIFRYFPHGGLQRDFLKIAKACLKTGHQVTIYTMDWQGDVLEDAEIQIIAVKGWSNHIRAVRFALTLQKMELSCEYDLVFGFNKMPGLDFCFVGDICYQDKVHRQRGWFYRLLPRYRCFLYLERSVFDKNQKTQIFLLTPQQRQIYRKYYETSLERLHLIPPGIERRDSVNRSIIPNKDQIILLFVASNFYNKGLDRAIRALAFLHDQSVCLWVVGGDKIQFYQKLANKLKVSDQIKFLGARDDLSDLMLYSDILIHPARIEAAGMVLLESITNGLPVITTSDCGYAFHIERAQSGLIIDFPFKQKQLNQALQNLLNFDRRQELSQNALNYTKKTDLYSMTDAVIRIIGTDGI